MSDSRIEFVGAAAAMADLRKWADQVAPEVARASRSFGARVADTVAGRVPVLTGRLASTVGSTSDDEGVSVGYDGGAPYDGWIEFGGSRGREYVPEGRYLYPVALDAESDFVSLASDTAEASVRRFSWSTPSV